MKNAKLELIETIKTIGAKTVDYARIALFDNEGEAKVRLEIHSDYEFYANLDKLDIAYDDRYGSQYLFGFVVFTDGTWIERKEYNGHEWWSLIVKPSM